jgi:hypothetical protein
VAKPFYFAASSLTVVIAGLVFGINSVINNSVPDTSISTEYQKSKAELIELMNQ